MEKTMKKTDQPKPTPAYTKADLAKWQTDMLMKQPAAFASPGLVAGVEIVSFNLGTSRNGAYIVAAFDGGGPHVTFLLNPVVAAALRLAIDASGAGGGWLDSQGQPVIPILDR
jgi:hypothetical protein